MKRFQFIYMMILLSHKHLRCTLNNKQLNRNVLTDQLYLIFKEQIVSHMMSAGDKINIDELARKLGVSNIPIREALSRLVSEGFVRNIPFKGMFVAEMNLKEIDEIFEIRYYLEELSIRKATPQIPQEQLQLILDELIQYREKPIESNEENVVTKMNYDVHGTILSYADSHILESTVNSLIERIHRYLNLLHYKINMGSERHEHETIVRALLMSDTEKAVDAMRTHLENSHRRLRANFD
jgi:DNA-binding GntR family transcriptional regulator